MKKIALFSDGTGNSSSNPQKTNVWRAYQALDCRPGSGQIAYYDNGVGTSPFRPMAVLGLAFGWGLKRNVLDIYGFLCRTYEEDDEIYAFGFSRGAFTIRVVVALIASQGIVDPKLAKDERDLNRLIRSAYRKFRKQYYTPSLLSFFLRPVRDATIRAWQKTNGWTLYKRSKNRRAPTSHENDGLIKFVGVWDTVDAYGLPVDELTRAWDMVVWPLTAKDRNLSSRVLRACHALALDEQRESFEPTLWNEENKPLAKTIATERISQVWFPGVHSNVGGGYPDDGLSFLALNWILGESTKKQGLKYLRTERALFADQANAISPLNDSRKGVGILYRYAPRNLERLCQEKKPGLANWIKKKLAKCGPGRSILRFLKLRPAEINAVQIVKPKIHHTVFDRIAGSGDAYAPINLPRDYAVVDAKGKITDIEAPGSAAASLAETPRQAKRRRRHQAIIWNKVWALKLLYYVTLSFAALFLIYPYLREAKPGNGTTTGSIERIFGAVSAVFRAIPEFIGSLTGVAFVETWSADYAALPYAFSAFLAVILFLVAASLSLNARLRNTMRGSWRHLTHCGKPVVASPFRAWLAGLLDDLRKDDTIARAAGGRFSHGFRITLEGLALVVILFLVVAVFSRAYFIVVNGAGFVCEMNEELPKRKFGEEFTFNPKEPCFWSGIHLAEGKNYRVFLRLSKDWNDGGIEADERGWTNADWYMYLLTPLRRHLFERWYQPILRVGGTRFERHAFEPVEKADGVGSITYMDIKPSRTGWLYLYMNDGVFLTPGTLPFIYNNNDGEACIRVDTLAGSGAAPEVPATLDCVN